MTLHGAIEQILREFKRPMKAFEIAKIVNERKYYLKSDKSDVSGSQISARVNNYQDLFRIEAEGISLNDLNIKPYKDFMLRFADMLYKNNTVSSNIKIQDLTASFLFLLFYFEKTSGFQLALSDIKDRKSLIDSFKTIDQTIFPEELIFSSTINFLSNSISNYQAEKFIDLIRLFQNDRNKNTTEEEFSVFFNDVVNAFSWKNNFRGGETSTPKIVSTLMSILYEIKEGALIFEPFAGRAGILTELIRKYKNKINRIFAGDIDANSKKMGQLNIHTTGFDRVEYQERDAFLGWEEKINADIIISNPPFVGKIENDSFFYTWQKYRTNDINLNAIQLSLYHLSVKGNAIIVIPESVLFGSSAAAVSIRANLIDQDFLQGVILLPKVIYKPYASISTALLLIDKTQQSRSTGIFLYDASASEINEFTNEIFDIKNSFDNQISIKEKARWVPKNEIVSQGYDLSVKKYLLNSINGENLTSLESFINRSYIGKHISSNYINKVEGVPYIQVGDLKDGKGLESIIQSELKTFISDIENITSTIKEIPFGSILISRVGTKLKPTLFSGHFPAVASSNIIVLQCGTNILPEYLISQLQSDYVQKQIEVIRRYNGIPNFNLKEFINIKIKSRSLEEQHKYVSTYYSQKISDVEKVELQNKDDELYNLISRIKHEVKQPVSSIGIDISILIDYLKAKEKSRVPISLNDLALDPLPGQSELDTEASKIKNIFERIKNCVDDAQETLQKAEETLNIGKGNLRIDEIKIKSFIESVIKPLYTKENFIIELKGNEHTVCADNYQLKVLFKHLIENAIKHGFNIPRSKEQNVIRIEIGIDEQRNYLEITVMNNGIPFAKGLNKTTFETKGLTSNRDNGSGFGGFHIKKIIENHKGEFQIAHEDEVRFTDFKVKFKIYLPLN